MTATPLDSALYRGLFGDDAVARLFTDSAEVRAMMLVEGALAKAQGQLGVIPEVSAAAIQRAAMEAEVDPAGLAAETGANGVPVPAFVAAFREAMNAPEHAAYLHWGATSQDIMDTALALRLRQALALFEARLGACLEALAVLAEAHAETPMLARTYGQAAVPTSFGAVIAAWGQPLLRRKDDLKRVRQSIEVVTLFGAAGTSSALPEVAETRALMAEHLGLAVAPDSRHATRDGQADLAAWLAGVCGTLGKLGADLIALTATGVAEVSLGGAGASSTMPQKANPVGPSKLVALANLTAALSAAMQGAVVHQHQRDGAAWFTEWLTLPQMIAATGTALLTAQGLAEGLSPNVGRMTDNLVATDGAVFAERLSFGLAEMMPRPEAQAAVKALLADGAAPLADAVRAAYPSLDAEALFDVAQALGEAPAQARAFVKAVRNDG